MAIALTTVRDRLGGSGTISLSELRASGFTRTFAGSGLNRVNPFEVAAGDATHPTASQESLATWENYANWNAAQATGDSFDITAVGTTTATLTWSYANGANLDSNLVHSFWIETCTGPIDCAATDPTSTGTETELSNTAVQRSLSGLTAGQYYVAAVRIKWDQDGDSTYEQNSNNYDTAGCCTDPAGTATGTDRIYWQQDNTTTTTTTAGTCECISSVCTAPCALSGEFCSDVSECEMV